MGAIIASAGLRRPRHRLEVPPKAIIQAVSFCITLGWALYSARLLSLGGKGSLETSWKNLAVGSIATAIGILVLTVDDLVESPLLDVLGSAIVAIGGAFMLFALRRQYSVWKAAFTSVEPNRVSTNHIGPSRVHMEQTKEVGPSVLRSTVADMRTQRRVLVEFDPASDYEQHVAGYLRRMSQEGLRVVLFTKQGSSLSTATNAKSVLLSFANEGLNVSHDGHMSVFIRNPSLILDAFASVLDVDPGAVVVVDTLTDLILSLGPSITHNLLWQMNELIGEKGPSAALLLLFNPKAHKKETCSLIEGFADAIFYCDETGFNPGKGDPEVAS